MFVVLRVLHLPILLWAFSNPRITFEPVTPPSENDALLPPGNGEAAGSSNGYGATTSGSSQVDTEAANGGPNGKSKDLKKGDRKKDGANPSGGPLPPSDITWSEWFSRFARLIPFLWPSKSGKLQILAGLCLVILVLGRAVNVLVPRTLGNVVDSLSSWAKPGPTVCELRRQFSSYLVSRNAYLLAITSTLAAHHLLHCFTFLSRKWRDPLGPEPDLCQSSTSFRSPRQG